MQTGADENKSRTERRRATIAYWVSILSALASLAVAVLAISNRFIVADLEDRTQLEVKLNRPELYPPSTLEEELESNVSVNGVTIYGVLTNVGEKHAEEVQVKVILHEESPFVKYPAKDGPEVTIQDATGVKRLSPDRNDEIFLGVLEDTVFAGQSRRITIVLNLNEVAYGNHLRSELQKLEEFFEQAAAQGSDAGAASDEAIRLGTLEAQIIGTNSLGKSSPMEKVLELKETAGQPGWKARAIVKSNARGEFMREVVVWAANAERQAVNFHDA